jgi:general stress protein 26
MSDAISPKENLSNEEAIKKLKELAEDARNCFFTTKLNDPAPHTRPMALQEVCDQGNLWFISSSESHKNEEISNNAKVQLYFQNNSKYEFLYVLGEASIHKDPALIEKYWTDFANAWFDGKDDPRVTIIKVKPLDSYYYETKENKLVAMAKMLFVAATGAKIEDGGVEGKLEI